MTSNQKGAPIQVDTQIMSSLPGICLCVSCQVSLLKTQEILQVSKSDTHTHSNRDNDNKFYLSVKFSSTGALILRAQCA